MRWTHAPLQIALLGLALACATPPAAGAAPPDGGYAVRWEPVAAKDRAALTSLRRSGLVDTLTARLNARLRIPRPVTLRIGRGVVVGPYAELPPDAAAYAGVMPATWLTWVHARLGPKQALWKALAVLRRLGARRVTNLAATAFLAHEAGHTLISMLDLPIAGREEDAADGFAVWLLLTEPAFGADTALALAGSLAPFEAVTRIDSLALSDAHELPRQRIVQILCWVYGSAPSRYGSLVGSRLLPAPRRHRCAGEWRQLQHAWTALLAPNLAETPPPPGALPRGGTGQSISG